MVRGQPQRLVEDHDRGHHQHHRGCRRGDHGSSSLPFVRGPLRLLGVAVIALPFAVGAPHLAGGPFAGYDIEIARQMAALAGPFAVATTVATAVQWLALGGLSGWAVARWVRPVLPHPALS